MTIAPIDTTALAALTGAVAGALVAVLVVCWWLDRHGIRARRAERRAARRAPRLIRGLERDLAFAASHPEDITRAQHRR